MGLEISRSHSGINLCQLKYALDLLAEIGFLSAKIASTPMVPTLKLFKANGDPLPDVTTYQKLIRQLLYLITTRPDLSFDKFT